MSRPKKPRRLNLPIPDKFDTKEEFEEFIARNDGTTVEEMRARGQEALPCRCGKTDCRGWAIVPKHLVAMHNEMYGEQSTKKK